MRDLIAGLIALALFLFALGLVSTLRHHSRSRDRERRDLLASGRIPIAEIPASDGLRLFLADDLHYYWGTATVTKSAVRLARVMINGSPLASYAARRYDSEEPGDSGSFADRPEGIAHDRWDVLIRTDAGDLLVECGSIRERVSQELARRVFDTVKADMKALDDAAASDRPPTPTTIPVL